MAIELGIGIPIAIVLYRLQSKSSDRIEEMTRTVADLTKQKARTEQEKKAFECQRIIDHLQDIQNVEQDVKTYLTQYKLGDPTLKIFVGKPFSFMTNSNIRQMKDALGQLQSGLNDNSLREQFLDYLPQFNVVPKRILADNFPQQEQQRDYLLDFIDDQMKKIQAFIDRFNKEMDFS